MRAYTAEEVWPAPGGLQVIEFDTPGSMGTVGFQAIIRPSGREPWIALFRTEDYEGGLTFLETWDAGPMLLACAGGTPHYFRADDPRFRVDLQMYPVLHRLRNRDLVILGDFTNLIAVNAHGLVWESPRLASDELADLEVRGHVVEGKGNEASTGRWTTFVLSLATGELLSQST
jgi:hypothetical protein